MSADVTPGTVEWQLFDCVQVNLAVLADRWHGPGTHLDLGAVLRFRPRPGPGGLPTVERSAADQLTESAQRLGLTVLDLRTTRAGEPVVPAAGRCVVADAYHLPWVPYFGRRHMDHSFLLEPADGADALVVDGYHNDTPWGAARPVGRPLSRAELAAAVPGPALSVTLAPAAGPVAPAGAALDLADEEAAGRYVTAYAEHPDRLAALDRLTLETWLLARSRKLHVRFLRSRGLLADGTAALAHVKAWESLAESVYLGYRRVERGRPEPGELFTRLARQLDRDREVFGPGTATGTPATGAAGATGTTGAAEAAEAAEAAGADAARTAEPDTAGRADTASATRPTPATPRHQEASGPDTPPRTPPAGADPARTAEPGGAGEGTPVPGALRERVAASAGAVLRTDPAALLDGRPLADVPGFTSFRVVEIVERLERELSVEFVADDLVPENLHHVDGICRIVLRALPTGTTAPHPARPVARTGGN
ncbi:acyl carrier protein [Streptomyces sp. NPDC004542]|uniref:acyl carrier protein n=1 Tax=Streptomyces sp. NPDC004542 TaxID=3154281 RepID=UPI0033AC57B2